MIDPTGLSDATSNDAQPPVGALSMWTNELDQDPMGYSPPRVR
jgi:hypothetical protein